MRWIPFLIVLAIVAVPTLAQESDVDTCPQLVESALEEAGMSCENLESGTVCYGNINLEAEPQRAIDTIPLAVPGDRADVTLIRSLRLSAMDQIQETWGIAIMDVRATRTDEPGSADVTIVMFGNVVIDNDVFTEAVEATANTNIRGGPSTTEPVIGTAAAGQLLLADGQSEDGEWLRVRLPEDENSAGWVSATLVAAAGSLDPVDPDMTDVYNAMQAFYFESGLNDAPCDEAPDSGLMLQTPEGVAEFTMLLNEVNIQLESTAYVQAAPGNDMRVYALEGNVTVEAEGVTRVVVPGTQLSVPLDEDGAASDEPSAPQPYEADQVGSLPTPLLADQISIAPPLELAPGAPIAGNWSFSWDVEEAQCPDGRVVTFTNEAPITSLDYAEDGETLLLLLTRYRRVSAGQYETVFSDSSGNLHRYQLTVTEPDRISGSAEITYLDSDCTLTVPFSLSLTS